MNRFATLLTAAMVTPDTSPNVSPSPSNDSKSDYEEEEEEEEEIGGADRLTTAALQRGLSKKPSSLKEMVKVKEGGWLYRVIDTNQPWVRIWFGVVFICVMYYIFIIPLRIGFFESDPWYFLVIETFIDIILLFDMFSRSTYPYYEREKKIITLRKTIPHYLLRSFWIDFIALFPFWFLTWLLNAYIVIPLSGGSFQLTPSWLKINRVVLILRLGSYFNEIEDFVVKTIVKFNPGIIRIIKFLIYVAYISHYITCAWQIIIRFDHPENAKQWSMSIYLLEDESPLLFKYLLSLYWSLMTMTGYGGTMPLTDVQTIFSIIVVGIGVGVYVTIIGIIGSLITHIDTAATAYRDKMDTINDYMKFRKLDSKIQGDVRNYYNYIWFSRKGLDESKIFADLPKYLRMEVAKYLNMERLKEFVMFKDIEDESFFREILVKMYPKVSYPTSYIIRQGETGHEMYFLIKGEADVVIGKGEGQEKTVFTLTKGKIFGEIALIKKVKRTASIKAKEFCDLFVLNKDDFDEILKLFPKVAEIISNIADKRYKITKKEKEEKKKRDEEEKKKREEEEKKRAEEEEKRIEEEKRLAEIKKNRPKSPLGAGVNLFGLARPKSSGGNKTSKSNMIEMQNIEKSISDGNVVNLGVSDLLSVEKEKPELTETGKLKKVKSRDIENLVRNHKKKRKRNLVKNHSNPKITIETENVEKLDIKKPKRIKSRRNLKKRKKSSRNLKSKKSSEFLNPTIGSEQNVSYRTTPIEKQSEEGSSSQNLNVLVTSEK